MYTGQGHKEENMIKINLFPLGPIQVNTYLVWDEESNRAFLVDPGIYLKQVEDKIKEEKLNLQYIILTHGHGDHIGGVEEFKERHPRAEIVCHKDELELLSDGNLNASREIFGRDIVVRPDITVSDGDILKLGGFDIKFIHTPGHTKGGMSVIVGSYVFSGDTLFRRSIGRTDFYGGDFDELIKSIKTKLFPLPEDFVVLPGHMDITTIGEEKAGNPFV